MSQWGTKNVPKKKGRYLITLKSSSFNAQVRLADRIEYPIGNWYWSVLPDCFGEIDENVIAWMKCPKPYVG